MLGSAGPKSTRGVTELPVERRLQILQRASPPPDAGLADEARELDVGAPERLQQAGLDGVPDPRRGRVARAVERVEGRPLDLEEQRILASPGARGARGAVELAHRPHLLARTEDGDPPPESAPERA